MTQKQQTGCGAEMKHERDRWLSSNDEKFLADCRVDAFQASGPGGQKKNRKYSAVRILHIPTGIEATASEDRMQSVNKKRALRRLRMKIAAEIRRPPSPPPESDTPSLKNPVYPLFIARILDLVHDAEYRISDAASALGVNTSGLVKILKKNKDIWRQVNSERKKLEMPPLK